MVTSESTRGLILSASRWPRFGSHDHDLKLSDQSGDRTDCCEYRGKHGAHEGHGDGNLDECVPVFIFYDDASYVPFVNEGFHFIDEIPSEYLYFFYKVL